MKSEIYMINAGQYRQLTFAARYAINNSSMSDIEKALCYQFLVSVQKQDVNHALECISRTLITIDYHDQTVAALCKAHRLYLTNSSDTPLVRSFASDFPNFESATKDEFGWCYSFEDKE